MERYAINGGANPLPVTIGGWREIVSAVGGAVGVAAPYNMALNLRLAKA